MKGWKRDVRMAVLALLLLIVSVLPYIWIGSMCMRAQNRQAMAPVNIPDAPCVALTFDDGPRRNTTTRLLEGLSQRGVHATFFIIGLHVDGNEDLIQRMEAEGHQVGIHSQNHKILTGLGPSDFEAEVGCLRRTLSSLLGRTDFMLRPPYGTTDAALCRRAGAPIILWSVDPEDWSDENTPRQVNEIVTKAKDGDIILLHDIFPSSVDTALQVVDALMAQGFRFVTVEELFALRGITPEPGQRYYKLPPSSS